MAKRIKPNAEIDGLVTVLNILRGAWSWAF